MNSEGASQLLNDYTVIARHFKGGVYRLVGYAKHTETDESLVIYLNSDGEVFARPSHMFWDEVETSDGERIPRFKVIASFR